MATLVEYWLGELDVAQENRIDEHLLGCGHCSGALQELVDVSEGIRAAVGTGAVETIVTDSHVQRLAAAGLKLREYRVPHNGSVHCTAAPEDDLLVTRLEAPLAGVERLDFERLGSGGQVIERLRDVPFNATAGEVVFTPEIERVRALPAMTLRIRLVAVAPGGERVVGNYALHHSPYRPDR